MTRPLCKHCGKQYAPRYSGRKYCSKKCSKNYIGWKKGKTFSRYIVKCKICGKSFETVPTSKKQQTCSVACRTKLYPTKTWNPIRSCRYCSKIFTAKKDSIRYCSRACGSKQRSLNITASSIGVVRITKSGRKTMREELGNQCQHCGWYDEPGILEIHHIDRNKRNNKRHNLKLLCPNCHSLEHFKAKDGNYQFKFK